MEKLPCFIKRVLGRIVMVSSLFYVAASVAAPALPAPGALVVFVNSNFGGTSSGSLKKDYSSVGSFWNDRVSSIKIYSGVWEFFEHVNYQGRSFRLSPGNYPTMGRDWNDKISSFKQVKSTSSNAMVERILYLTNVERKRVGSPALSLNSQLTAAAQNHTNLMIKRNQLSHQLSAESSVGDRISRTGYRWSAYAENIEKGSSTPEKAVSHWMASPGHRANLLNPKYQHLGVGYGNYFWTQDFGRSQ